VQKDVIKIYGMKKVKAKETKSQEAHEMNQEVEKQ